MSGTARQLGLPFIQVPSFAPDFLEAPSNADAITWLEQVKVWPLGRLALWGEAGTGKSHLLYLWSARHGAEVIPGAALALTPPTRAVAIDDADAADERPLFHMLNAAAEAGLPVLLTGGTPPSRWPTRLPDLTSRLRATASVEIGQPDDDMLRSLLARLLAERQMAVPEPVQAWLLTRLPRTAAAMREAAIRLDRASLAARRPVTRQIAAFVLAAMQPSDGNDSETDDDSAACRAALSPDGPQLL